MDFENPFPVVSAAEFLSQGDVQTDHRNAQADNRAREQREANRQVNVDSWLKRFDGMSRRQKLQDEIEMLDDEFTKHRTENVARFNEAYAALLGAA